MARATSSLPVPLSPMIRTVLSVLATRPIILKTSIMRSELPISRLVEVLALSTGSMARVSWTRSRFSTAFRTTWRNRSTWNGLGMKSKAPERMASMVTSLLVKAVTTTTSTSGWRALTSRTSSMPLMPPIWTSVTTRSGRSFSSRISAFSALSASSSR